MEKLVKKHAKGGTYYVKESVPPKASPPKEEKSSPTKGWNIPELNPTK